jgi:hypothetical protein
MGRKATLTHISFEILEEYADIDPQPVLTLEIPSKELAMEFMKEIKPIMEKFKPKIEEHNKNKNLVNSQYANTLKELKR